MTQPQNFNPAGKEFNWMFSDTECHRIKTGTCSLVYSDAQAKVIASQENPAHLRREGVQYCRHLAHSVAVNGYREPVKLYQKYGCYYFTDGRHRTCIALQKGQSVPAIIE